MIRRIDDEVTGCFGSFFTTSEVSENVLLKLLILLLSSLFITTGSILLSISCIVGKKNPEKQRHLPETYLF